MEPIEIRYDKKKLITAIALFSVCIAGSAGIVYFSNKIDSRPILKYIIAITDSFAIYVIYVMLRRIIDNKVIIRFDQDAIEIEDGKGPARFYWKDVRDLQIEKRKTTKSKVFVMKIADGSKTRSLDLSQLDKTTDEIRDLIAWYRKTQAP
jgi:hypothetical protein